MDGKSFTLEIITPQRIVFNDSVSSFTAPGALGGFQVLYNHAPLLAALAVGEARLRDANGAEIRFATGGGFVEVKNNHVVMLADSAEKIEEIDVERAERARQRAQQRLSERAPDTDLDRAQLALQRALNRLRLAGRA